ncbi:ATP-binding protein [Candidatus Poribacteria bacterium]|nr:ATP-binding protein [Candidatus Poribacteria bacterium]
MLIEFKVANFKSFREEQTLSLVASNYEKSLPENLISPALPGMSKVKLLRGAAIYGPNASGKTKLLEAVKALRNLILYSTHEGFVKSLLLGPIMPFRLDSSSRARPTSFEVMFVAGGCRYLLTVACDSSYQVLFERLVAFPKGAPQEWYSRRFDSGLGRDVWGGTSPAFKDDASLRSKVRPDSMFLTVGKEFHHPQLTPVYEWFSKNVLALGCAAHNWLLSLRANHEATVRHILAGDVQRDAIVRLLKSADFGIADVQLRPPTVRVAWDPAVGAALSPATTLPTADASESGDLDVFMVHRGADSEEAFDLTREESGGTRVFFERLGPWLDALDAGSTLFVDEIESSLHPLLVRELIRLVVSRDGQLPGPQLIFTTHSPILLDRTLLRRDQVWFTEKDSCGATHLYPLTDFAPRKDEALSRGYLAGRYGAVPFIPEGLKP